MMLLAVDRHWQEHLAAMDELRDGVYLRAQGQKDPLVEFKNEAFGLFAAAGIDAYLRMQSQPAAVRPTLSLP
jgi:preprotein translocase subunit SecA